MKDLKYIECLVGPGIPTWNPCTKHYRPMDCNHQCLRGLSLWCQEVGGGDGGGGWGGGGG